MDRRSRQHLASHYDGHLRRRYVRVKLATDPVYAATAATLAGSTLPVLDIGCGIGLLGQYLHMQGHAAAYLGLDRDPRKILAGQRAARRIGRSAAIELRCADAHDLPSMQADVTLLDMLHYLSATDQLSLLQLATSYLAPRGKLVIRNVLREPNWRFHATRIEEFFLQASGWIRGGPQHYPTGGELRAPLERAGLEVSIKPLRGRTPFNSYLIVAQRTG
ncbi:MAG: class I SAM-dependent methyltransferase [Rhodanobacter sp.]